MCYRKMDKIYVQQWLTAFDCAFTYVCICFFLSFAFQMYIALISLHALVMVVLHFFNCFEDDWTSE